MAYPKGAPKVGGRKKGTPNKLTGEVKQMILNALAKVGGEDYLAKQAEKNAPAFLTLVGKVLPLQVSGDPENPLALTVIERRVVDPAD